MHVTRLAYLGAAAGAVLSLAGAWTATASATTITGAGSTLVAPLEADWNTGWQSATGNSVSYSAVGSTTGITEVSSRQVDFGASDAPMTASQQTACNQCEQIPWALSATAIGFHLTGISTLKLTGKVLAEIYLGVVTNWSNSQIKALNPSVRLPNRHITVIFRHDGSGDTYAFSNFLSRVSHTWSTRLGTGTTIAFPTGVGTTGNGGVTAELTNVNGSIGYVAASYLLKFSGIGAATVQNAAGRFEYPNLPNIASAAASATTIPANNAPSIVDPPASARIAYPISTFTYVIVPLHSAKGALLRSWIGYVLTAGQQFGPKLDFPGLPQAILTRDASLLDAIS